MAKRPHNFDGSSLISSSKRSLQDGEDGDKEVGRENSRAGEGEESPGAVGERRKEAAGQAGVSPWAAGHYTDDGSSSSDENLPLTGSSLRNLGAITQGSTQSGTSDLVDENLLYFNEFSGLLDQASSFSFASALTQALQDVSNMENVAKLILEQNALKKEILKQLGQSSKSDLKLSLKHSKLKVDKNDRNYLLSLNPHDICREFQEGCQEGFGVVTQVLFGIEDPEQVFRNQHLMNNLALIYSSIARMHNRSASGYALYLGAVARDGGLREESIKLFPQFCHVRTLQKYDHVLAKHSRTPLEEKLRDEKQHLDALSNILHDIDDEGSQDEEESVLALQLKLKDTEAKAPKMLTTVWGSVNLSRICI